MKLTDLKRRTLEITRYVDESNGKVGVANKTISGSEDEDGKDYPECPTERVRGLGTDDRG